MQIAICYTERKRWRHLTVTTHKAAAAAAAATVNVTNAPDVQTNAQNWCDNR